jgi:hypothetical protein
VYVGRKNVGWRGPAAPSSLFINIRRKKKKEEEEEEEEKKKKKEEKELEGKKNRTLFTGNVYKSRRCILYIILSSFKHDILYIILYFIMSFFENLTTEMKKSINLAVVRG